MDRLTELERKLENLARLGAVCAVDAGAARCRVQSGSLQTAWLPWLTRRAGSDSDWWAPSIGEQVLVLSPGGDPAQGLVLPAVYSTEHPAPESDPGVRRVTFEDGSTIAYNNAAHVLHADLVGDAVLVAVGDVTATADGDIAATAGGNVTVTAGGNASVSADGDMSATAEGNLTATAVDISATASGNLTGSAGGQISLSAPAIGLTGNLTVTGNVSITGAVNATGAVATVGTLTNNGMNVGSLHTHPVPGVGMSGPPV